ncbi:hypothetical protein Purlil1_2249 [Purpureocillium lilacinum]|uniref:Uncharacterized protein n=1 Tax=Purpureocillium lilacinum TaxID=33203 RepID=A0ABR0C9Z4_PURLI|nr:hypothetical protein Purlil1_2249 [Purpureocillium lilacinum]
MLLARRLDRHCHRRRQYLPEAPLNHSSSIKWFSHLPPRPSECPALDSSTNALGVTMLGRKTGDHNLIYNGLKLYGDSLATFRSWQVRHRTGRWHESLLVAMVLQLFEAVECTPHSAGNWLSHSKGILVLLRAAGPTAWQKAPSHECFLCCRVSSTVATILLEEPTFLASDDWCQLPWATFPKDDAHILIDTLLRIPGLLFLSNNTARKLREGNKAGAAEDEQQLHRVCQDIDMALCEWHDIARKSGYLGKLRDFTDAHHLPFSDIMEFRDVMQAQMMLFYWTGRLLAHDAAQRVEQARLAIGLEARKLQCDGRTLGDAADNICRSVAYCQKESNGMLGMQLSTLPLRTAEHFYQSTGEAEKALWCRRCVLMKAKDSFLLVSGAPAPSRNDTRQHEVSQGRLVS